MIIYDQFGTVQNLQRTLISKAVTGQELFFSVSYSKPALATKMLNRLRGTFSALKSKF